MNENAPIILFVYNRLEHAKRTIESLRTNVHAGSSSLFIFSEGPKSSNNDDFSKVNEVRKYIRSISGFRNIEIISSEINKGLADSIIKGVTAVLQHHDRAIVLEDDLLFSPMFLTYANEALQLYRDTASIFSIGGYAPPIRIPEHYRHEVYLSRRCSSWGWATWKDRWNKTDWEMKDSSLFRRDKALRRGFSRGGRDLPEILDAQIQGKISSWAIRWDYAHFKNEAYALKPVHSLVTHIGHDASGTHCGISNRYAVDISWFQDRPPKLAARLTLNKTINERCAEFYDQQPRSLSGKVMQCLRRIIRKAFRIFRSPFVSSFH